MLRLIALLGLLLLPLGQAQAADPAKTATLYKSPQCGCCEGYADYLRQNGYAVTVNPTHDLVTMGREAGMADDVQGCHLTRSEEHTSELQSLMRNSYAVFCLKKKKHKTIKKTTNHS